MADKSSLKAPPSKRAKTTDDDDQVESESNAMSVDDDDESGSKKSKAKTYQLLPGFGEHKRAVSSVKFAPTRLTKRSALCASSSADGVIKLFDVQDCWTKHQQHQQQQPGGGGASASASGGTAAASDSKDNSSEGLLEPKLTCTGHSRGINEICWNPVSPLLASASDDKTVRLWDAVTGDTLVEYRGHDNFVFCVDQHEHMVVSGSFDETVKIWDVSHKNACRLSFSCTHRFRLLTHTRIPVVII